MRKVIAAATLGAALVVMSASPAFGFWCANASKNPDAGIAQPVINGKGEVVTNPSPLADELGFVPRGAWSDGSFAPEGMLLRAGLVNANCGPEDRGIVELEAEGPDGPGTVHCQQG
jgi:hypothetical protein